MERKNKNKDAPFEKEKNFPSSEEREKRSFLDVLKKIGFSVWLGVMIIGGVLAFLTSLLLL